MERARTAERLTPEQKKELGVAPPPSPEEVAMWAVDPAYQEYAKKQLEKARGMAQWASRQQYERLVREVRED